uniref:Phosphatidate cytidylyltransferase, mitochondrial n=1 Tax=Setaria digitata TaxID=48799 RepID=A0A915PSM6_9BILA
MNYRRTARKMAKLPENSSNYRKLRCLVDILPLDTVEYACAYGSGAVPQDSVDTLDKMIDFIIVTRNSNRFHEQNLKLNPAHYSSLRFLGHQEIARIQRNYGARVYCNTRVFYQNQLMKYSIIETDDLLLDLIEWRWMYLAGRLQKHVINLITPSSTITSAIEKNRLSALQAALLFLPDKFTLSQFYDEIIWLSYRGDFRMLFGEDKNKIKKIAEGSKTQLSQIYLPLLKADNNVSIQGHIIEQDRRNVVYFKRIMDLPLNVLWNLQLKINSKNGVQSDIEEIAASLARQLDGPKPVAAAIEDIVWRSAVHQTAKNVFSAGIKRSVAYAFAKITKMLKSLKHL